MSDHWEMFPCAMGDHTAWIAYDHGIRDDLGGLPFANVVKYQVALRNPDDRGLPQGEEFEKLDAIEDQLIGLTEAAGGVFVGRISVNGARHFYTYTSATETEIAAIAQRLEAASGYEVPFLHREDAERTAYWKELYPTDADWRVMKDIKVERSLREAGDSLEAARPVTHYAYFPSDVDRSRFIDAVGAQFDEVRPLAPSDAEDDAFGVALVHVSRPDSGSMNAVTVGLLEAAGVCNGEYDGWETEVRKG
jgi:hypothetical protein